ncbi:MAG: N-acetyltransferase family protein [Spirochaeta sp.]
MDVHIREAVPDDAAELLKVMQKVFSQSSFLCTAPEDFVTTEEQQREFLAATLHSTQRVFLVALHGTDIVGTINFAGSCGIRRQHAGEIGMSVLKEYWGSGIGRQLLAAAIDWAAMKGYAKINLQVREDNQRAIRLYEALGFKHEGCIRDGMRADGRSYNLLCMGLVLPSPGSDQVPH